MAKRLFSIIMGAVLCIGLMPSFALANEGRANDLLQNAQATDLSAQFNADNYKANITQIRIGAPATDPNGKKYLPVTVHFTAGEDLGDANAVQFLEGFLKTVLADKRVADGIQGLGMTLRQMKPGFELESNCYSWKWNNGTGEGELKYDIPLLDDGDTQTVEKSAATGQTEVNGLKVGDSVGVQIETWLNGADPVRGNEAKITIVGPSEYPKIYDFSSGSGDISKIMLSQAKFVFNKKVQKPRVESVKAGGVEVPPTGYKVEYSNPKSKNAGRYSVTVTGDGGYTGSQTVYYRISKAVNKVTFDKKPIKRTYKASALKDKTKSIKLPKKMNAKFGKARWKTSAKDASKVLRLSKDKTKVIVKKNAKPGTYTLKLKAYVPKSKNYTKATSKKTLVVKVKVE